MQRSRHIPHCKNTIKIHKFRLHTRAGAQQSSLYFVTTHAETDHGHSADHVQGSLLAGPAKVPLLVLPTGMRAGTADAYFICTSGTEMNAAVLVQNQADHHQAPPQPFSHPQPPPKQPPPDATGVMACQPSPATSQPHAQTCPAAAAHLG